MSQGSAGHLNRIVQLVAEVSRDPAALDRGVPIDELAGRLGTTPAQVRQDLRTLTAISDEASAEWLQSLAIYQEGDRVAAVSRGPYRRPLRFTPDELLAIRVGLSLEGESGEVLARRMDLALAVAPDESPVRLTPASDGEAGVGALARECRDQLRTVTIKYAGARDRIGAARSIEPHQVVSFDGRLYLIAWCRHAGGWRHFRADRVIDAIMDSGSFAPRADFRPVSVPADIFRSDEEGDDVVVRYSPVVSRWLSERFPDATRREDGSVEVTYRVVEPEWLLRMVIEYGAEAVVVSPESYRRRLALALS